MLLRTRVIHHMRPEDLSNGRERAYKPTKECLDYYKAIRKIFLTGFIIHQGFTARVLHTSAMWSQKDEHSVFSCELGILSIPQSASADACRLLYQT